MKLDDFLELIGFSRHRTGYGDKLISTAGGFLGIFFILLVSQWLLDPETAILIIPSMGATAVLLFAAPHAPFSQPWNVLGGHAVSALVGVACWQWIDDYSIAAAASVGLATGAMYFMRCIHPPGGATALAAVIGTEQLHNLGYSYELAPVMLNTVTILLVAIVFNAFFDWRRYPASIPFLNRKRPPSTSGYPAIDHADFVYALSHIDTIVDISEDDLVKIYQLATKRHAATSATE